MPYALLQKSLEQSIDRETLERGIWSLYQLMRGST